MANSLLTGKESYRVQKKSVSGSSTSYGDIQLVDAEQKPFISNDELLRCLLMSLTSSTTAADDESKAKTALIASTQDIENLFK